MEELLREDEQEGDTVREFYERNLPHLNNFPVSLIPSKVSRHMAIILHRTLSFQDNWKEYIEEMGISDNNLIISEIEANSKLSNELPFYVALRGPLSENRNLDQIIRVLLAKERLDVLNHMQPFIRSLLRKITLSFMQTSNSYLEATSTYCDCCQVEININEFNTMKKTCHSVSVDCDLQHKDLNKQNEISERKNVQHEKSQKNSTISKTTLYENSNIQGSSKDADISSLEEQISYIPNHCKDSTVSNVEKQQISCISNSCEDVTVSCVKKQISTVSIDRVPNPTAPLIDTISVFILHTELDIEEAQRLSVIFQEEGLIVRMLADVDYLLMIDSVEALSAIFLEVDFVVPIVSMAFLEQIHPLQHIQGREFSNAMNIRYIYQLMQNEYQLNWCLNFRVRPVMLPEFNKRNLRNKVLLSCALRLWTEVPKLIKVLRDTKIKFRRIFRPSGHI